MDEDLPSLWKKIKHPKVIYLIWLILAVLLGLFSSPLLGNSGSVESSVANVINIIDTAAYGFLLIGIATSFIYKKWFKRFWYINTLVIVAALLAIITIRLINSQNSSPDIRISNGGETLYNTSHENMSVGKDEWVIDKEYYRETQKIRSVKFYRNGNRDSIWKVFDEHGVLIKAKDYRPDSVKNKN